MATWLQQSCFHTCRDQCGIFSIVCRCGIPSLPVQEYIVSVALFLVAGFFMALVSLRDEDLCERGFWCTGKGKVTRHPEVRGRGCLELCKGPWSLRGPREMAMARASLVRSSFAWLHVLQQMYRIMAPAGVIIPAPAGGTSERHAHGHSAEHEEGSERTCRGLGARRDGSPSLSKRTVRGFALRVECTGPARHVGESGPKLGPTG